MAKITNFNCNRNAFISYPNKIEKISFNKERIEKVLPRELLKRDKRYIEQYIINAIEKYKEEELERGDAYDLD